jgi:hypothetical protein
MCLVSKYNSVFFIIVCSDVDVCDVLLDLPYELQTIAIA